jgi:S-adenosylmethionine synthetase
VADPVSIRAETHGTGTVPDAVIEAAVREVFDLRPRAIIAALRLEQPIYRATAAYGHFGREPVSERLDGRDLELFTWERIDRVAQLRAAAKV